jgi:hypothetical protein
MKKYEIFAEDVISMLQTAYEYLRSSVDEINNLNVFPVPDGDTGTNMLLTLGSVVTALEAKKPVDFPAIAETATQAALLGARGNSGVILSQIVKGLFTPLKEGSFSSLGVRELATCFETASQTAYRAIAKPVEGTILTVIRKTAEAAKKLKKKRKMDLPQMLDLLVDAAEQALRETPELLPVLKEAGVIDAGGLGLVLIVIAFRDYLNDSIDEASLQKHRVGSLQKTFSQEEINFTYCTEILLRSNILDIDLATSYLNSKGDSVIAIRDDEVIKIHVHTDVPAEVINHFASFGDFIDIKVNNMRLQTEEANRKRESGQPEIRTAQKKERKISIVAVSQGEGLKEIFRSLSADIVVEGGQTMNPSSKELLDAIESAPSDNVIVLPNNRNIILSAEQAAALSKKNVQIIPSKTIQQGLQALLNFNEEFSLEQNTERMKKALNEVVSIDITRSVKDSTLNGLKIEKDDYIGILDNNIVAANKDLVLTLVKTLEKASADDASFITIFTGKDLADEEIEIIKATIEKNFPDVEFEVKFGGQHHYPLFIALER